jgi:hypothetical protein
MQNAGALNCALYSTSAQISFLFLFRNKFLILVSKEMHFVREGNIVDKLEYNEASALRMRIPIIIETF